MALAPNTSAHPQRDITRRQTVYVASDLHLGGEPGFQMCPTRGMRRLAAFVHDVRQRHLAAGAAGAPPVHLVLAGDIIDFLAETPLSSFTMNEGAACEKLKRVICDRSDSAGVFSALSELVKEGAALTLILGNHDLELSLPAPRRLLLERLGSGRIEFLYDGQALALGGLLIEHGNRADPWNAMPANELRSLREQLSRQEAPSDEALRVVTPGSALVTLLMNNYKKCHSYSFIDLLKPEDEVLLPVLAALDQERFRRDIKQVSTWINLARARSAKGKAASLKLGVTSLSAPPARTHIDEALDLAAQIAGLPRPVTHSASLGWGNSALMAAEIAFLAEQPLRDRARRLGAALRYAEERQIAFSIGQERPEYLDEARRSLDAGFQVVVYGHTHLAKRIETSRGWYLNTGTWADLMRLPRIAGLEEDEVVGVLEHFLEQLTRSSAPLRTQFATFARITIHEDGSPDTPELLLFAEDGKTIPVTNGLGENEQ